jgi:hypothetical protein
VVTAVVKMKIPTIHTKQNWIQWREFTECLFYDTFSNIFYPEISTGQCLRISVLNCIWVPY